MNEQKKALLNKLKAVFIILYFLVLFTERFLTAFFSVQNGGEYALLSGNTFNYIAYAVAMASLAIGTALFIRPTIGTFKLLFLKGEYSVTDRIREIAIAVAALLVGGMMHTGATLPWLQFIAYGFLIGAMIVRTVEDCLSGRDVFVSVVSVVYLTLFSMTIPVCYISFMEMPLRGVFFGMEFLAVFALVPVFGYMFCKFMRDGVTPFYFQFPALMLLLSGAVIGLGWKEDPNLFVLIFVGLTLLVYLALGLIVRRRLAAAKAAADTAQE